MKLLLNYYHPVIIDLAMTFQKLGCNIDISYNISIKDHYGDWKDLLKKNQEKYKQFQHIPLQMAMVNIAAKKYDLVGLDGVFNGDEILLKICKEKQIKWFCINGYPYQVDEPSQNILAFSWFLPQIRYLQKYQGENGVKNIDWKNIAEKGESDEKNICVFYPNFWELKEKIANNKLDYALTGALGIYSYIHRYEECNKWNYEVFKKISDNVFIKDFVYWSEKKEKQKIWIDNINNLSQFETWQRMYKSYGTLMLKHADCPGIALFESLLIDTPILTLKSYVNASMNQEILIDGYTAIIADNVEELIDRINNQEYKNIRPAQHLYMLTDFDRQKRKLETFISRCLND